MKNLESFGIQEMNLKELNEVNGGIWQLVLGALIGAVASDWDSFENGLMGR